MSFVILGLTDVLNALRFGLKTTLIILPFTLIFWSLKLRFHTPSSDPVELTDEETHHSEDEAKPSNYIAYIASATASAFVFNLILFPILVMRGGIELISILLPTFIPLAIFNACLAPVFIQIGDKLWTKSESVALKYVWGATLGLFVLMVSSVCRPAIEMSLEGILSQWSIFLVFAIAIISYMAGGLVLAKTYRTSSPESLFS